MYKNIALATAAMVSAFTALPAAAEARHRDGYYNNGYSQGYDRRAERRYARQYDRRNYNRYYGRRNCKSGTTGMIVGGAGGALLGREIAGRRDRTTGTILGAAVGALAGRAITRTC